MDAIDDNPAATARAQVAVLDDDPTFAQLVAVMLEHRGHRPHVFHDLAALHAHMAGHDLDLVLVDYWIGGEESGIDIICDLRGRAPDTPVVLVTASDETEVPVAAIRVGAFDFVPKPFDQERLFATVHGALEHRRLLQRVASLEASARSDHPMVIGSAPAFQAALATAIQVAETDATVLVCGESGTGKEVIARTVHERSTRSDGPFIALNMATMPRDLLESTLFGHERGAFSGAVSRHLGACEQAAGGTLFLDEIADLPLELQPKLLRFLQDGSFRRVGGDEELRATARIVAATHRDMQQQVVDGTFRQDLYYRLAVVPIVLPPLRERTEDIEVLATHFLRHHATRHGRGFREIAPKTLERLSAYAWPGNVRELGHVMERAAILNEGDVLEPHMLPPEVVANRTANLVPPAAAPAAARAPGRTPPPAPDADVEPLEVMVHRAIENALTLFDGDVTRAACELGVSVATIYRRIKQTGIDLASLRRGTD